MNKLIFTTIALSFCLVHSASAKNLGTLSEDQVPQNLIQASEFLTYLNNPDQTADTQNIEGANHVQDRNSSELYNWGNWWGYGSYYPYYYGSYYYPYYNYYPYYGSYGYWLDGDGNRNSANLSSSRPRMDAAHAPVVCFASDSNGNWFANADIASKVTTTQERSNTECHGAGGNCSVNLGCAIAYGDREQQ